MDKVKKNFFGSAIRFQKEKDKKAKKAKLKGEKTESEINYQFSGKKKPGKTWKDRLRIKAQQKIDKEKTERFKEKQRKEIFVTVRNGKLVAFTKDD